MNIAYQRLNNQGIIKKEFSEPAETVKRLGAVQAQDYYGSLWGIGLRTRNCSAEQIESAIANKKIIRTWPMRFTLHFTSPEDVRWMLKWFTPRVISASAARRNQLEIDESVLKKSRKIFTKALQGGKQITRTGMYNLLEKINISSANQRGIHILAHLSMEGLLCFGAREGKQFTFTLLEEWVPPAPLLTKDEALCCIAKKYFVSHGPATIKDFAWWTGLTLTDSKRAVMSIKEHLEEYEAGGSVYYFAESGNKKNNKGTGIYLLPAFDEYLVSYKDRSAAVHPAASTELSSPFTLLSPVIVINGFVEVTWTRELIKNKVKVKIKPFRNFNTLEQKKVEEKVKEYCKFYKKELHSIIIMV